MKIKAALKSLGYDLSTLKVRSWRHLEKIFCQYREINKIAPASKSEKGDLLFLTEEDFKDLRIVADDYFGSPSYINVLVLKD